MIGRFAATAALALLALLPAARAADAPFRIGYVEWSQDPRYKPERARAEFPMQPWGRPLAAAEQAIRESAFAGSALKLKFELDKAEAADAAGLAEAIKAMVAKGTHYVIVDADGAVLADLVKRVAALPVVLLNISAADDTLRGAGCSAKLLHAIPNHAMLTDALAQYLVLRRWASVLVLKGPNPGDAAYANAFARSAKRFGLKIADTRPFRLGLDPREREFNNLQLLTGSKDYDAVFVADTDGEFARTVPYQTARPRVVLGANGLVADGWHWSWEKDGARQLNNRLLKAAGRHVTSHDWAAWMAVKSVVEAVTRAGTPDFASSYAYLRSPDIVLDGFKGFRQGYRPWDGQLRQPILLNTGTYAIAVAPIEGFLDPVNNLDTLGFDAKESACPAAQRFGASK
jgi:ABC transporter substrate binding protein (PQQ-dependent alcohol dehydrogenase system)